LINLLISKITEIMAAPFTATANATIPGPATGANEEPTTFTLVKTNGEKVSNIVETNNVINPKNSFLDIFSLSLGKVCINNKNEPVRGTAIEVVNLTKISVIILLEVASERYMTIDHIAIKTLSAKKILLVALFGLLLNTKSPKIVLLKTTNTRIIISIVDLLIISI